MRQSEWLEAVRGGRPVGLGTTGVTLTSWAGLHFSLPPRSWAVWTLHPFTSSATTLEWVISCWPYPWNGISKPLFPHYSPSVTLKNYKFNPFYIYPHSGLKDPALLQPSSFPSSSPPHNLILFFVQIRSPFSTLWACCGQEMSLYILGSQRRACHWESPESS